MHRNSIITWPPLSTYIQHPGWPPKVWDLDSD